MLYGIVLAFHFLVFGLGDPDNFLDLVVVFGVFFLVCSPPRHVPAPSCATGALRAAAVLTPVGTGSAAPGPSCRLMGGLLA